MRSRILIFIAACLYYSGLVRLARWWTQRSGQRLIILNYHRASEGDLRRHLLYLRQHYRLMHLEEALHELYSPHDWKQYVDQRTPLVLTFDDGYRDNYTHAYPLACELQVPITIFLIPGYIDNGRCFWWLEGDRLVNHTHVDEVTIEGRTYHLVQQEERKALVQTIYDRTYHSKSVAEREEFLAMISKALSTSESVAISERSVLTWNEVREMEASGWVSFGAHTMHHPVLGYLTDSAEVQCEVRDCRARLERQLGHQVRTFAYPLGRVEHISEHALQAVQDAGFDWAVTTIYGINSAQANPYLLRRFVRQEQAHWLIAAARTSGIWQLLTGEWFFASFAYRKLATRR